MTNTNSGAYNGVLIQNDASNQVVLGIGGSTVGGSNQNRGYSGTVSNIDYYLMTNNTERMRITSDGKVGIGTSSPSEALSVPSGNVYASAFVVSGNAHLLYAASSTDFGFRVGTSGPYYSIGTTGSDNMRINSSSGGDMLFAIASTERMRINSSGNIGVGTTAPQSKMEIRATSGGSTFNALTLSNYVGSSVNTGVALYFDPNGAGSLARAASIQSVQATSGNFADLRFFTANSDTPAERMRITPAGDVGIGTSPGFKFDVSGDAHTSGAILTGSDANGWGRIVNSGGAIYFQAGSLNSGSATAQPFIFTNMYGGSERMRIGSTGIVYVNTTSTPSFGTPKLVVDGAISGKGTVTINSSTATTIAEGAGLLLLIRNTTNGGTAVVSYENAQTPVIISTSGGTTFITGTPSGSAQIQLINKSGNLGIAALASGDRNNNVLSVTILQVF